MSITLTLDKRPESWTRGQNQFVQISCKCKSLHLVPCHDSDAFTGRVIHKDCASIRWDSDAVCPDKADQILLNYQSMLHLLKSAYNIAKMCYFDFLLLSANIPRTNLKSPFICCWDTWVCWLTPPWENKTKCFIRMKRDHLQWWTVVKRIPRILIGKPAIIWIFSWTVWGFSCPWTGMANGCHWVTYTCQWELGSEDINHKYCTISQFDKYKVIARTSDLSVASFDHIVDSIVWEERRRDGVEEIQGDRGARPGQREAFFPDFEDAEEWTWWI